MSGAPRAGPIGHAAIRRAARRGRGVAALAFLVALASPALAPSLARPAAAASGPSIVSDARYLVQPAQRRLRVVVDATVSNRLTPTRAGDFYYERASLAVLPGATSLRIALRGASDGTRPTVAVAGRSARYTLLAISLGRRLLTGESIKLRLIFDIPDPGGAPTRSIRVGSSLVAFPVWAFATVATPPSSVRIVLPPGFAPSVVKGRLPEPVSATTGESVISTGPLAKPLSFFAYLRAEAPATYRSTTGSVTVGAATTELELRAWPEEDEWAERTRGLVAAALPELAASIGLPPPALLVVEEASDRATAGYAGRFDAASGTVRIAYDARPIAVVHAVAHAWFNGSLLAERWANEAFASSAAAATAERLEIAVAAPKLTAALERSAVPLNAWGGGEEPSAGTEAYAAIAAELFANAVAERAGADGLRDVWRAAAAGEAAYQPGGAVVPRAGGDTASPDAASPDTASPDAAAPERRAEPGAPDWRALLDLLEERTDARYDDLWRRWVVRPGEEQLLNERAVLRRTYAALLERAGEWELSPAIRAALGAWRFAEARELIATADEALAAHGRLVALAAAAGLVPSDGVRRAFESAAGPGAALVRLDDELDALAAIRLAEERGRVAAAGTGPLETLGGIGVSPAADLAAARAAYEAGDLAAAIRSASAAHARWARAGESGLRLLLLGLFLASALGGAAVLLAPVARRRRAARLDRGGPYATLAPPDPPAAEPPAADGEERGERRR